MSVLIAFLIVGILGLILGLGLAVADKKFAVEKDEKLVALEEAMPGANCGGCGYAGCQAYAEAVFNGEAKPGLCSPGGDALDALHELLEPDRAPFHGHPAEDHGLPSPLDDGHGRIQRTVHPHLGIEMHDCMRRISI